MTSRESEDEVVGSLTAMFRDHPAWGEAAAFIAPESMSNVYFTHREGEVWHLEHRERGSDLVEGAVADPDFVFRFTPESVERLGNVTGGVADFALELFSLIESDDPKAWVDVRVAAPFSRLREHGFLNLLIQSGPRVAMFGLRHGVIGVSSLAKFVRRATNDQKFEWEV